MPPLFFLPPHPRIPSTGSRDHNQESFWSRGGVTGRRGVLWRVQERGGGVGRIGWIGGLEGSEGKFDEVCGEGLRRRMGETAGGIAGGSGGTVPGSIITEFEGGIGNAIATSSQRTVWTTERVGGGRVIGTTITVFSGVEFRVSTVWGDEEGDGGCRGLRGGRGLRGLGEMDVGEINGGEGGEVGVMGITLNTGEGLDGETGGILGVTEGISSIWALILGTEERSE